jgi:hypothetical protein
MPQLIMRIKKSTPRKAAASFKYVMLQSDIM